MTNLKFKRNSGGEFVLEYEPFLVSAAVEGNIFGAKTENRFKSCTRDLENT